MAQAKSKRSKADAGPGPADLHVPPTYDPDSLDGLRFAVAWALGATSRLWRQLLDERLKSTGLTPPRWRVLAWAQVVPGIKQSELAERMSVAGPTLVRMLDILAEQGLIERREYAADHRAKEVWLTPKAEPLIRTIAADAKVVRDVLLQDVSEAELRTVVAVLTRIRARLPELGASDDLGPGPEDGPAANPG